MKFEIHKVEYDGNKAYLPEIEEVYYEDDLLRLEKVVEEESVNRRGRLLKIDNDTIPFKVQNPEGTEIWVKYIYPIPKDETKVISKEALVEKGYFVKDKPVELEGKPVKLVEEEYRPCNSMEEFLKVVDKRNVNKIPPYSMPFVWVKYKASNTRSLITDYADEGVELGATLVSWELLFANFTFLDNAPCGVKINQGESI